MNPEIYLQKIEKILTEEGFSDMSMERLALKTGTTKRTLYNNFESRDDIFRCLTDMQKEKLRAETLPLFSKYGTDATEILAEWYRCNMRFLAPLSPAYLPSLRACRPQWHRIFCDMMRQNCGEFMALLVPRGRHEGLFARNFDIKSFAGTAYRLLSTSTPETAEDDIGFLTRSISAPQSRSFH